MSTTITTEASPQPSSGPVAPPVRRPRHRTLLAALVAGALGIGIGAATVSVTSSGDSGRPRTHTSAAASPHVDVTALLDDINALPVHEEADVVAALAPSVRAQLRAAFEQVAVAAEH
jgi:hypothetical protein